MRLIADTEEPVRQASAVFRERLYAKAIGLLQKQQEALESLRDYVGTRVAMTALSSLDYSGLWAPYWKSERAAA